MINIILESNDNLLSYKEEIFNNCSSVAKDIITAIEETFYLDSDRNYGRDIIDDYINRVIDSNKYDYLDWGYIENDDIVKVHEYFHGYIDNLKNKYIRDDTYKYYNPHPNGKNVGDCVKRAFTNVTGLDYMEIQRQLNRIKREIGASAYNNNSVWKEFIKRNNFRPIKFPVKRGEPRMNGYRFAVDYPKGRYVLNMAKHLSSCIDGVIYDTWDCRNKCVYNAFEYLG